jgi:hypothetical protein
MSRRESRLHTGRTNRPPSVLDDVTGRDSPARPSGRLSAVEMLRVGTAAGEPESSRLRSRSALAQADDTRMSISVGKSGPSTEPSQGDALDLLLSTPQRQALRAPFAQPTPPASGDAQHRVGTRHSASDVRAHRPVGTSHSEARERFLALPMTPKAAERQRLEKKRGGYSKELTELQVKLMGDAGKPFAELQKALVFAPESGAGKGTGSNDDKMKKAIAIATGDANPVSDDLIQELRSLTKTKPGKQIDYETMMQVVWDDKYLDLPKGSVKPGRGLFMKYLFLVGSGAGCYNDNLEPNPSLFGVKKGSSSVRYSLFTNENVDLSTTFKLVPPDMMKAVDADMKISVSHHPATGRPLDPWLSYLAVSQGKKCGMGPPDQVALPSFSFACGSLLQRSATPCSA